MTTRTERGQIADMSEKSADCVRDGDAASDIHESAREHSLESESVREQPESVRERRYESQDVTGDAGHVTESPEMSHDTRKKLEADVRKHYAYSTTTLMYPPSANKTTDMLGAMPIDTVIGWLVRQAAITERECMERSTSERVGFDCAECAEGLGRELDARCDPLKARIAELCDQVDALTIERDTLQGALDIAVQNESALEAERDQWRDAYRDSERLRLELVKDLEHARRWSDKWRDLVRRYEGLCDGLLDERDRLRGEAS